MQGQDLVDTHLSIELSNNMLRHSHHAKTKCMTGRSGDQKPSKTSQLKDKQNALAPWLRHT